MHASNVAFSYASLIDAQPCILLAGSRYEITELAAKNSTFTCTAPRPEWRVTCTASTPGIVRATIDSTGRQRFRSLRYTSRSYTELLLITYIHENGHTTFTHFNATCASIEVSQEELEPHYPG